ncbi:hypothetical protein RUM44_002094 [Polyplax serrata]|uniref:Uncharacterized protein n=1 Tax=Polyplax serrata TaxID=468196 RepID=A0ABR1ALY0_POLSC
MWPLRDLRWSHQMSTTNSGYLSGIRVFEGTRTAGTINPYRINEPSEKLMAEKTTGKRKMETNMADELKFTFGWFLLGFEYCGTDIDGYLCETFDHPTRLGTSPHFPNLPGSTRSFWLVCQVFAPLTEFNLRSSRNTRAQVHPERRGGDDCDVDVEEDVDRVREGRSGQGDSIPRPI